MQIKKFIIFAAIGVILCSISALIIKTTKDEKIETYSAKVMQESTAINSEHEGTILNILVKDGQPVKIGQELIEILTPNKYSKCLSKENLVTEQSQAAEEYQDAAIMYKDGIITKEEYDKSLGEYKDTSRELSQKTACKNDGDYIVYATGDGIIALDNTLSGAKINKGDTLAAIKPEVRRINAYFSPKYKKKIKQNGKTKITFIKYPEKIFEGEIIAIQGIDINGLSVIILVKDNISNLNINDNDDAIVRLEK